jgi:hypothetical protein
LLTWHSSAPGSWLQGYFKVEMPAFWCKTHGALFFASEPSLVDMVQTMFYGGSF